MSGAAKPGRYSRLAGLAGTGPGTGQLVVSAQHWPEAVEATSYSAWWDRPRLSPRTNASLTAIIEMPRIMLLQILAACPAPAPPQCTAFLPMAPPPARAREKNRASAERPATARNWPAPDSGRSAVIMAG